MLKQRYTEETNGQNNDKVMKPTLGSHSFSVNYCNILVYFEGCLNRSEYDEDVLDTCTTLVSFPSVPHFPIFSLSLFFVALPLACIHVLL